jgi:hypothetical protein
MGYEHVDLALESDRYTGVEKAVVVALCKFINTKRAEKGDTVVWPGMKTLCRVAGWKYKAVQLAVDRVTSEDNPAVEIVSSGAGTESTHYRVHLDRLSVASGSIPSQGTPAGIARDATLVGRETLQCGVSHATGCSASDPTCSVIDPTVGRETPGNQEENQEENQESKKESNEQEEEAAASAATRYNSNEDIESVLEAWESKYGGNLNGNRNQFLSDLTPFVKQYGCTILRKAIIWAYTGGNGDDFWDKRIHTPKGFFKCLRGDFINQFRLDHPEHCEDPQGEEEIVVRDINVEEL